MKYEELEHNIIKWGYDKGILSEQSDAMAQAVKTLEETTELLTAIQKKDKPEVLDALGDILVTIILQAEIQQVNLTDCLENVYEIISKRTGKMEGGMFVKDGG